jgi:branched-chain amino acid transport system ATP-binding protein
MSPASSILSLSGIEAGYGPIKVLKGIDLHVAPGEIVTLIGANGAGKTTTLMTIANIVQASAGTIHFAGEDITALPAHTLVGRGLVQVPEGRKIFPRLTVRENLLMGAYLRNDHEGIARDLKHVYELFPILTERQDQAGGTLSGGEQQMLAIARALMAKPKLLLLDEPSMGIAPLLVQKIFKTIQHLNAEEGLSILLIEQNARQALSIAHRGYVLETGNIALSGPAKDLLADERVQAAYLGG